MIRDARAARGRDLVADARSVEALGDLDEELTHLSEAGKTRVADHYQWDMVAKDYEDMLESLLNRRNPNSRSPEDVGAST